MHPRTSRLFPLLVLSAMFLLMVGSVANDSTTTDEQAHIPAGYSYVRFFDYRLNPEHPPLVKALAGLPLLFLDPNYPTGHPSWTTDTNGQWQQGAEFIYNSGNRPEVMLMLARLPMMLLTVLLGALLYFWSRRRFGAGVATMTLLFYAFSPTVLAHGRYVTTDIGAALGFFIGIASFLRLLEKPTAENTLIAGLAFGIAELLKFSTVLLIPIYGAMLLMWFFSRERHEWRHLLGALIPKTLAVVVIGILVIWGTYGLFTWNYPHERQIHDTETILQSFPVKPLATADITLVRHHLTRPLGHYLLGVLMVAQRSESGNTATFLGEVSARGSRLYFPVVYFTKEALAFHILSLMALVLALRNLWWTTWNIAAARRWMREHFVLSTAVFFIIFYWAYTIRAPLNIGVRHVLPTFPFIYLLVARQLNSWFHPVGSPPNSWIAFFASFYRRYIVPFPRRALVFVLFLWLMASVLSVYPHFLSYYNELAGGPEKGYRVAVDSNYDWGQDLARLGEYVRDNDIQTIAVDYFGGGDLEYYLRERFIPWQSAKGPAHGYFAISATLREGAVNPTKDNFYRKPEDSYEWLKGREPVDRVGYSIFIYRLP